MSRDQTPNRPAVLAVAAGVIALVGMAAAGGCGRREPETGPYRVGDLAPAPEWERLHGFQWTISRDEFLDLLTGVYGVPAGDGEPGPGSWAGLIRVGDSHAEIVRSTHPENSEPPFRLNFARGSGGSPPPRYWRSASELPPAADPERRPLDGLRVAIDPGHIGGSWAKLEERHYEVGDGIPVHEGSMTLAVARHLDPLLTSLGAQVTLIRDSEEPVTADRPADFEDDARAGLAARGFDPDQAGLPAGLSVTREASRLFYRTSEILARADRVNREIRPDLVLCLHFNAEAWGDPAKPTFSPKNHFHMLVNGCYSRGELALDDQRFAMLQHLLQRNHAEESAVSASLAEAIARRTGLPPYVYKTPNARQVGDSPYVYARNLLANRTYLCPVAFFEPYVMNSEVVYLRVQEGDYDGERHVAGKLRTSLFREYASAVAEGLTNHYRLHRPQPVQ